MSELDVGPARSGVEGASWDRDRLLEALEAHRRGISDAPLLRKWSQGNPPNSPLLEGGEGRTSKKSRGNSEADKGPRMAFVISTDEEDRHGDVIVAEGWRLDSYQRNPVFLWAHNYTRPVIGRALEVWTEPHRLLARMEFAPTDFAQEVARLYQGGYQRGVSVGFKPLRYEERRHEKTGAFLGIRFLEQELLEVSAVPVPANRSALRRALEEAPRVGEYLRRLDHIGQPASAGLPGVASYLPGAWPELAARVDDLGKLVEELARMVGDVEAGGRGEAHQDEVAEVLAALRHARGR